MAIGSVITPQIEKILNEYENKVEMDTKRIMKEVADETAAKLRSTSPGSGRYAASWAVKKQGGTFIVHNKDHYRVAHLLEFSHGIYNQYGGPYRSSTPQPHIAAAEQQGIELLLRKIREAL